MDDKRLVASASMPKEIQTLVRQWDEIDKSKLIGTGSDEAQRHTAQDGEIAVMRVDDIEKRIAAVDLSKFMDIEIDLDYDDEEFLPYDIDDKRCWPPDAASDLENKKIYGKSEIMKLLGCGNQKALYFLKLLFQMEYAIKIGKSYIITAEEFDRFFKENKGKEIVV